MYCSIFSGKDQKEHFLNYGYINLTIDKAYSSYDGEMKNILEPYKDKKEHFLDCEYINLIIYNPSSSYEIEMKNVLEPYLQTIPFILVIVNYLPFYLLPISDKKVIVQELLSDMNTSYKIQVGYLSEYVINFFRIFERFI
jgi:hypothetical protein